MKKANEKLEDLRKAGNSKEAEEKIKLAFWQYFTKNKEKLPFVQEVELLYNWFTSGKLSRRDKAIVVGALLYFINPMDAIVDFAPIIGFLDDLGVIGLAYRYMKNRAIEEANKENDEKFN